MCTDFEQSSRVWGKTIALWVLERTPRLFINHKPTYETTLIPNSLIYKVLLWLLLIKLHLKIQDGLLVLSGLGCLILKNLS